MLVDYDNPTNDPFINNSVKPPALAVGSFKPYRCPICFNPVSPCMTNAISNKKTYGCTTMSCKAPIFEQKDNESKFIPLVEWNKWVIEYRKKNILTTIENLCVKDVN